MFISTREKINLQARVEALEFRVDQMVQDLHAMIDKLTTREEEVGRINEAQKKKRNAYASAYYYKKKAEKANLTNQGKI